MAGLLAGMAMVPGEIVGLVVLPVVCLMVISLIDDARGLPARWRFLVHFAVAGMFLYPLHSGLSLLALIVAAVALVWMINLYNFMDGSDGLAGGMAIFGFGFYGLAAILQGETALATTFLVAATAALAFLCFNFHPARIFMGDTGSTPLGFLAGALGLVGWEQAVWPLWFPLLVFSPFILDATVTLLKRLLRGEKVWQAHREHYYQRLVQMGWGHRKTALFAYLLMLATGGSSVGLLGRDGGMIAAVLVGWLFIYVWLFWSIDQQWVTRGNAGRNF